MTSLMGGQADAPEDMFAKLESMRAVITEVNTQFKDPVRSHAPLSVHIIALHSDTITPESRKRPPLSVSASQSSSRFTRPSVWSKS